MSKVMLINATRPAEVRAAILNDNRLDGLEIETRDGRQLKGNIYKGRVANVEPSLNACFIEFGLDKQGFLPLDEIHPSCFHAEPKDPKKPKIEEVLRKGKELVVQVVKDPIGGKGAALTTHVSLAGRYLVLMPFDENRGVSRKITSDSQRKQIKELAGSLKVPDEFGFIVRTAGMDRTKTELNRDAAQLVRAWKDVLRTARRAQAPRLLHADGDLVLRMLRDYFTADVTQVIIDQPDAYRRAVEYFDRVMPRSRHVLTQYVGRVPLFSKYRVEQQVEELFGRRADLPSGGYILIDPTEALIAIDVNSGRSTRQKSQQETALHTNMEAAAEVARQLRLRDLGGLVVIDFIDMPQSKHNRQVEKALKDALKDDKARTYVGKISENGLCEVNRQRLKQALRLQTHRPCPTCDGRGIVPSAAFVANSILRSIEAKAANGTFARVVVELHPELADFVQNQHRREIVDLEERFGVLVSIEGRPGRHRGEQELRYEGLGGLGEADREWVESRRRELEAERAGLKDKPDLEPLEPEPPEDDEDEDLIDLDDGDGESAELEDAPADKPAEGDAANGEAGRRKKRRRRRKKRGGEGAAADDGAAFVDGDEVIEALPDEDEEDEAEGDADGDAAEPDAEAAEDGAPSAARRRRLRRRRRRKGGDGGEPAPVAAAEAGADAGAEGDGAEDDEDAGDTDGAEAAAPEGGRRRRRGGRRRRKGGGPGAAPEPAAELPVDGGPPPGVSLAAPLPDGLFAADDHRTPAAADAPAAGGPATEPGPVGTGAATPASEPTEPAQPEAAAIAPEPGDATRRAPSEEPMPPAQPDVAAVGEEAPHEATSDEATADEATADEATVAGDRDEPSAG